MKRTLAALIPVGIFLGLWMLFCAPYFFKSLVPFPSTYLVSFFPPWNASYSMPVKNNAMPDVITQIYPWKKLTIDSWKNSMIPLWNPYGFSGTPLAANYQSAVFSPMNLLFFILPFLDAWSLSVLFQPLLAGFGMFLFLRALGRSSVAALIGAVGFMFCNFLTTWMAYGTLGYAIGLLPWALWGVVQGFNKRSVLFHVVLAASVAFSLLSGHFQISCYVVGVVFLFILYKAVQTKDWRSGIFTSLFALFGVLLTAPQLLVTYEAYIASVRSASFIKTEIIPWQYLVTIFSPDFYGNPVTRNDWFGHYAEWGAFVGVIPLLFAFIALFQRLCGYKKFFMILIALAIGFSCVTPLINLLVWLRLPVLSTSAASRIIVLLSFAVAAFAAYGVDDIAAYWKAHQFKKAIIPVVVFWLFVFILWGAVLFTHVLTAEQLLIAKRNLVFPTIIAFGGTIFILSGFLSKKSVRIIAAVGLVLLTCIDLYRFASKWMPFDPRNLVYPEIPSLAFIQKTVGVNRVFGNIGGEVGNTFSLPLVEGYDALYQGRYGEFINAVSKGKVNPGSRSVVSFDKNGMYKTQALELLGIRYIYHRISDGWNVWAFPYWAYTSDGSMRRIYSDAQYEVYEFTKAFPRAYLASSYRVVQEKQKIIDTMFSPDTNLRDTLVLEEKPESEPAKGEGTADIRLYTVNRINVQTQSTAPKLLFLSDVYDSGWHVTVDGKPSKLLRADYDFRAVYLPAGSHMVEFTYLPDSFRTGLTLSVFSVLAIVAVSIWEKRYEDRNL